MGLLKAYSVLLTVVLSVLLLAAFRPVQESGTGAHDVLRAERLEILNPDGSSALILAGKGRLPGPTFGGTEYPAELSGGRSESSGMIFFNEEGDEVGGLVFHGSELEEGYRAGALISFDQFQQDQVVALQYTDDGAQRGAGLSVWDRSREVSMAELLELLQAHRGAKDPETKASLERELSELAGSSGENLGAHRIFLGSSNETAALDLKDRDGRSRLRLLVDPEGNPRLEFLDPEGAVLHAIPEAP